MQYTHWNNPDRDLMFRILGEATSILLNSERKKFGIASIGAFVFPFAKLNQIKIFYGNNRYPMAYVSWAYVTAQTLDRLRGDPTSLIEIEEVNAGDNLLIVDLVSQLRNIGPLIEHVRHIARGNFDELHAVRYDKSQKRLRVRTYRVRREQRVGHPCAAG